MRTDPSVWSEVKQAQLRELWDSGLSVREIADLLGGEFTRGAVIGKASRLRLGPHKSPPPVVGIKRVKPVPLLPVLPPPLPMEPPPPPRMRRLQLVQLADHHCRWPCGDPHRPGFFFCGADAHSTVYCSFHMRVAFARTRAEV